MFSIAATTLPSVPEPTANRAPDRVRTPWWFRVIRALLNLALLVLLGVQVFALVLLSSDKHIQLPEFARQALEARLQEQGLRVHFSSLEASLSGTLLVRDPQIYLTGSPDPVIEAEYVIVEPDWFALLWSHRLSFSELRFGHATFYCPPENSRTGERQAFLSQLAAGVISQGNHWWRLDYLRGQFLNLQFAAQGNFVLPPSLITTPTPTPRPTPTPNQPPANASLAAQYRQWARQMLDLQPQFDLANNPLLDVEISGEDSGLNKLQIYAIAAGAHTPTPEVELGPVWAHFAASWDGAVLRVLGPASVYAESARYTPSDSTAPHLLGQSGPIWARLQLADGAKGIFTGRPLSASLLALAAQYDGYSADSVALNANLRVWPALPFSASLLQGPDWLTLSGRVNFAEHEGKLETRGGTVAARAKVQLSTILNAMHQPVPEQLLELKLDGPVALAGNATITPEGGLESANATLRTDGARFERIELDSLRARVRVAKDEAGGLILNVSEAECTNRTWQVHGAYFENFRTKDFGILVNGDIEPRVLDPYFESWWATVWDIVKPGGQWPQADVAYYGNWGQRDIFNTISVYAQIANARARGVRMNDISVRVIQRPEIVAVYDLTGHAAGGGQLKGGLFWTMKPPYEHIFQERLVFDTTLPLPAVAALGGDDAANVIAPLDSSMPPTIHFVQRTGGLANPQPHVTATTVHAEFPSALHAYHVPLDRAVVDVTAYEGLVEIPHFDFGIAGGQAEANATVTTTAPGKNELRFRLLVQNARHADFLAALGQFRAGEEPAPAAPGEKSAAALLGDPSKQGFLDLTLSGQMLLGQPDTFVAAGAARLREAQLGKFQLLGALSRMLADIQVPLGEFSLDAATSDVKIAHEYLRLPNLVVTGPSARIVAAGTYHIPDNELSFNALIFPIAQWDSFLARQFASLMNPFSNTVTLKLNGKYEKPQWQISMNPLRLFENRTVEGPAIPDYPANADGSPALPPLPPLPPLPDAKVP
ncbi:MAG TPA: AsmA-like C-terminal region-containing protein [Opitutales bacterium]|nr:AsmA-like C-terminal region-containing protein [Opitutales bacterium]